MKPSEIEAVIEAARGLRAAESSVRVLRTLSWDPSVRQRFFARGACELPEVSYPSFDARPVHEGLDKVRRGIHGESPVAAWLRRSADAVGNAAELLAHVGQPSFLEKGARLFGLPTSNQGGTSALALAHRVEDMYASLAGLDLGAPPLACRLADWVAGQMREACVELFGERAPQVMVVDQLSANALAGPRRILVRRDACFSDRDVYQLIQHEAYVHVCTSLNGRQQEQLPILGASHPGTTRTQEGLAVFAEYITGTIDPDRFRRLAGRVLAIQMSIEGADFLEVYRFFLGRGVSADQAFENARRVFRGGVLTGGAPFMKDTVYIDGFLRVSNFLRAIVAEGRIDCLPLLFCGKLDLDDIPAMAQLAEFGVCQPPLFLPPWASDRRFLVAYLTYSSFLDGVRLADYRTHYQSLLAQTPRAGRSWSQWAAAGTATRPVRLVSRRALSGEGPE